MLLNLYSAYAFPLESKTDLDLARSDIAGESRLNGRVDRRDLPDAVEYEYELEGLINEEDEDEETGRKINGRTTS